MQCLSVTFFIFVNNLLGIGDNNTFFNTILQWFSICASGHEGASLVIIKGTAYAIVTKIFLITILCFLLLELGCAKQNCIFCIKRSWIKFLARIALYRIKGKKYKSHQHPNSIYYYHYSMGAIKIDFKIKRNRRPK
jgi:hypothetical protein